MMQKDDIILKCVLIEDAQYISLLDKEIFSDFWSEKSFLSSIESDSEIVAAIYLKESMKIIAYIAVSFIFDEANINRIAVASDYRGNNFGTMLLDYIETILQKKVCIFNLEVRESNLWAIKMYEKSGYIILGKRRRFYRNPDEDALLMTKRKGMI